MVETGYKQTAIGVIPKDWDVLTLESFGSVKKGKGIRKDQVVDVGLPCIRYGEIYTAHHYLIRKIKSFITLEVSKEAQRISQGDILFAGSGETREEIGKCAVYLDGLTAYAGGDIIIFTPKKGDSLFLSYLLNHPLVQLQKSKLAQGDAVVHLYSRNINELIVPFPETKEQSAIAQALSDADELIAGLDRLIEKKRAIKQGVMQELLTGKRRLPGFKGEWIPKRIGAMLGYEQPGPYIVSHTDYSRSYTVPVLTANKGFIIGYSNDDKGVYDKLPVIVFDDFTLDNKYVNFPFKVKSSAIKLLRIADGQSNLRFLYERMQLINFPIGDHKRYYISEYQNQEIKVPKPKEQEAIANVSQDFDNEIEHLKTQRKEFVQIKQGMMQELLTGRIRLV